MAIASARSTKPGHKTPHAPRADDAHLAERVQSAIRRCSLDLTDLTDLTVLTEAATGAYVVTPVMAALAGAQHVIAVARSSRFGTIDEVRRETKRLARELGVGDRIEIIDEITRDVVRAADIVTNSGHVRPISRSIIEWMKPTTVVPLMYEAWEFRPTDLDLDRCRQHGVTVVGTNERHPSIDVFAYLGRLAVRLLEDADVRVNGSRVLLLCDNPFGPYIERGLVDAGATADTRRCGNHRSRVSPRDGEAARGSQPNVILVALRPQVDARIGEAEGYDFARDFPGVTVVQFWGDLDRAALTGLGVRYWPIAAPSPGHMGILLSALGPEPVVRLQAGGLKSAELAARLRKRGLDATETACALRGDARVTMIDGESIV